MGLKFEIEFLTYINPTFNLNIQKKLKVHYVWDFNILNKNTTFFSNKKEIL